MTACDSLAPPSPDLAGQAPCSREDSIEEGSAGESGALINPKGRTNDLQGNGEAYSSVAEDELASGKDIDKGWAWVICSASFFANFILDGVLFSFGVIMLELLDHFEDSKSKTAWVGSALLGFSMAMGPVVSLLLGHFSCRQVTILGSVISSAGFALSIFAPNVETMIFTYGVIGGCGFGLSYVTAILVVGLHFNKKRALATGIAMSGSGVGTFAVSYFTERLLDWYGLHGTMLIIAGLVLNVSVCGALMRPLVKRPNRLLRSCCKSSQDNSCCNKNCSSSETVDHDKSLLQDEEWKSNPPIVIVKRSSLDKPFLTPVDRFQMNEKKTRLFHSNDHMFPVIDTSDRRYNSDCHLHNLRSSTHVLEVDSKVYIQASRQPLKRRDIFYSGSIYNLPEYKKDPNMNSFLRSMTSLHSSEDCPSSIGDFTESIRQGSHKKMSFVAVHKELLCDKIFLMLLFVMTAWTGHASILTYLPDLAVSKGVSSTEAALLISAVGVANIIGRIFAGWLTNRSDVDSVIFYTCAILLAGAISAAFPLCTSFPWFVLCACIFGLCMASCVSLRTVILADVLGVSKLTKAFGIVAFLQGLAFTVGPPISGALFDSTLSFLPTFLLVAAMYLVSGVACALVRPAQKWLKNGTCLETRI